MAGDGGSRRWRQRRRRQRPSWRCRPGARLYANPEGEGNRVRKRLAPGRGRGGAERRDARSARARRGSAPGAAPPGGGRPGRRCQAGGGGGETRRWLHFRFHPGSEQAGSRPSTREGRRPPSRPQPAAARTGSSLTCLHEAAAVPPSAVFSASDSFAPTPPPPPPPAPGPSPSPSRHSPPSPHSRPTAGLYPPSSAAACPAPHRLRPAPPLCLRKGSLRCPGVARLRDLFSGHGWWRSGPAPSPGFLSGRCSLRRGGREGNVGPCQIHPHK
ncbi:basic proline-rich protein-like [Lutra lutra]|uniref:basic proline-rich protein-like n=1 Tax=Lutra lutra TaxID=9657 RepID=UPI001FD426D1|nr:basic proline-rich protein-like [Lutra lutra]